MRLLPLLLLLAAPLPAQSEEPGQTQRPNIVVILSDDHAQAAMGAYGGWLAELDPTPRLDRFASQGTLFENAFCTNSICGPSRAVFLTGKHSHRNGFAKNGDRFDGSQATFPSILQAAGYTTALFGKWHLGSDPQGFDQWRILPGQGDYYNPVLRSAAGDERLPGYCTDLVTDLAIDWLENDRPKDEPFLLLAWHKAPHRNWMPSPEEYGLYQDADIPLPASLHDEFLDNASPARFHQMGIDGHLNPVYDLFVPPTEDFDPKAVLAPDPSGFRNLARMTPEQRAAWDAAFAANLRDLDGLEGRALIEAKHRRYVRQYLETVRGMDRNVGRLLDHLDTSGLAENTLVVYASDQGFFLGEHGWFDKRWMYEESLRLPMVVRWPGHTRPGTRSKALVQNLDLAPTLLQAAGVPLPTDMQGASLAPLLAGEQPDDWRRAIYYHYYGFPAIHHVSRHRGIRTERHKLIQFYSFDEWELYDLERDPEERHNLFGQDGYAKLSTDLALELGSLARSYGDGDRLDPLPPDQRLRHRPLPAGVEALDLAQVREVKLPAGASMTSRQVLELFARSYVTSPSEWPATTAHHAPLSGQLLLADGSQRAFQIYTDWRLRIESESGADLLLVQDYRRGAPETPIPVRLGTFASGPLAGD